MAAFVYRLQLLLEQKEEAEKAAARELTRLEEERDTQVRELQRLELRHRELIEKREKCRREMLTKSSDNGPLAGHEVQARAEFVKALGVQIDEARNDVLAQKEVIEQCEVRMAEAKVRVEEAQREVEVL